MNIGIFEYNWGKVIGGSHMYTGVSAETLSREHDVTILHQYDQVPNDYMAEFLEIDLSRVRFQKISLDRRNGEFSPGRITPSRASAPPSRSMPDSARISSSSSAISASMCRHSITRLEESSQMDFPFKSYEWFHDFGQPAGRRISPTEMAKRLYNRHVWRERFASYHRILANSQFTRTWLKRRWFIDSTVVYPPSRDGIVPQAKGSTILGVAQVRARQEGGYPRGSVPHLCDRGLEGWRLVLAGGLDTEWEGTVPYVNELKRRVKGYPIELRMDVPGRS